MGRNAIRLGPLSRRDVPSWAGPPTCLSSSLFQVAEHGLDHSDVFAANVHSTIQWALMLLKNPRACADRRWPRSSRDRIEPALCCSVASEARSPGSSSNLKADSLLVPHSDPRVQALLLAGCELHFLPWATIPAIPKTRQPRVSCRKSSLN